MLLINSRMERNMPLRSPISVSIRIFLGKTYFLKKEFPYSMDMNRYTKKKNIITPPPLLSISAFGYIIYVNIADTPIRKIDK